MMIGTEKYVADELPIIARGTVHSEQELDDALKGAVRDILNDTEGRVQAEATLASASTSDFDMTLIQRIVSTRGNLDSKRVGEAIAQHFLVVNSDCFFPCPVNRDLRNPNASPAGADLVGFKQENSKNRFAFGEVKTSSDKVYPPNVMYGETGLKKQLEALRDDQAVKNALVLYLTHKAMNSYWEEQFKSAVQAYCGSQQADIALYGILVRDVEPDKADLEARAKGLNKNCPKETSIELRALYLPTGCLERITERISFDAN